ncbi:MAG: MTH1187 family thiamine-binding protein [Candidatus Marinimicrobia bacterium]|nr:MTH1187 family thiamine-binding protein [Candidatus Neomarinimicrobiota bacterium]
MLVDLSVTPLTGETQISEEIARVVNIVEESGIPYQLTPTGTVIEGSWSEIMSVVEKCHNKARESAPHVITTIKIEDEEGAENKLIENVNSVQEKMHA